MEPEFLTYRSFNDQELVTQLTDILKDNGVDYKVEEDAFSFDPGFRMADALNKKIDVKIRPADFTKVEAILGSEETAAEEIDPDYYLFIFTDDELMDILRNPDEWNHHDVILARKILGERGIVVDDNQADQFKQERLEKLKGTEPVPQFWIFFGYVSVIFAGIFGVFIGWHLLNHKKTLPNGDRVYGYTENDRQQGRNILYLSIVAIVVTLFLRFFVLGKLV